MRATTITAALALATGTVLFGQHDDTFARIRAEAYDRSQVMTFFDHLVINIGPRLTGSPEHKASAEWARQQFTRMGLQQARLEPFEFGRGWVMDRLVVEMIEPRYMPLVGYAEAWASSTKGEIVGTPVFVGNTKAGDLPGIRGKLAGAIVFSQPLVTGFVREDRLQPTAHDTDVPIGAPRMPRQGDLSQEDSRAVAQAVREASPGAVIRSSAGEHGTMFVLGRDARETAVPSIVLMAEHYNMVARMLERGLPVKMRVHLQTRYLTEDQNSYNVLADLPGSDPALKDEIVLLGAHLDSWHSAPGATDNADGSAAVMEAMRILKTLGVQPRRTIRAGLWGGEEQGLLGARAHVRTHYGGDTKAAARAKLSMYLNLDPGMGPIYGWYTESTPEAKALFDKWIEPLKPLGVRRNIDRPIGSTDHVAFRQGGIPGFNPVQDYVTYDVRTHHTNVDTYERVREEDLKQNAAVLAWFAFNAAMTDEKLPRPTPSAPAR